MIETIWNAPKPKEVIHSTLEKFFKSIGLGAQKEFNEINILAEYQLHNLIFLKHELLFSDRTVALLLNIFWKLLDLDLSVHERASAASIRSESAKPTQRNSSITFG